MKILVVDDATDTRLLLRSLLRSGDHHDITEASSAKEAFRILGMEGDGPGQPIDLVLMDLRMPEMSGIEACGRIKSDSRLCDTPIIMVTACSDTASLEDAFEAGVTDYITKPVGRIELLARVRSVLTLKSEMDCRKQRELELLEIRHQLEEANYELKRLSIQDALTGIANRRIFEERMDIEWRRAVRDHSQVALILTDVDNFKLFNDTYGHQAGDECLKAVARALQSCTQRPADTVARFGGEEFVAILPRTDLEGAVFVAERMREAVAELKIPHSHSPTNTVTISLGCAAVTPAPDLSRSALLKATDDALYRAKEEGRNRVVVDAQAEFDAVLTETV